MESLERWFPQLPREYVAKKLRHNEMNLDSTVKELLKITQEREEGANVESRRETRSTTNVSLPDAIKPRAISDDGA